MYYRIKVARFLIKLGRIIQSAAVFAMRPDDLVEFNRRFYSKPGRIQHWSQDGFVNSGLTDLENSLFEKTGITAGSLLVLGLGGGREAIHLVKMGFEVTGVDFIPEMVEQAKANAEKCGTKISCLVQEISRLQMPQNTFDMVWLSAAMYSCVPTRKRRVEMLNRIFTVLKPGGYFVFGFLWNPEATGSRKFAFLKKMTACLCSGGLHYEKGDILRNNFEFMHAFSRVEEVRDEIGVAGFDGVHIQTGDSQEFAGAVVRKPV